MTPAPSAPSTPSAPELAGLAELLTDWLPDRRWYAGKGRPMERVAVVSVLALTEPAAAAEPMLHLVVGRVDYAGGDFDHYQLLIGTRAELPKRLEHVRLGRLAGDPGRMAYDAVFDAELTGVLLTHLAGATAIGPVRFAVEPGTTLEVGLPSRVLGSEQSNTSVVYGDNYILKLFRRLAAGVNPDLELTRALGRVGCAYVAAPLGWIEGSLGDAPVTLGMLAPFLRTGTDGWALAATSVRDLYAEADLHADEVGGDFAGEAERLGHATAVVHADLARALPTGWADAAESQSTARQLFERLDRALIEVAELAPYAAALRAAYAGVAERTEPVAVQRIHGDYHLGQVLRVETKWVLLDFEGEPARPLPERTALMSPLRDVAGMLRSFDYAAQHLLADHPGEPGLAYRAGEWAARNRNAFCDGYAQGGFRDPREEAVLLRAFELDKAVYEVVYEARHRPGWLHIPLRSIDRLVG
jgi:maltokinase